MAKSSAKNTRSAYACVQRPCGAITWVEDITVNAQNRVTIHNHPMDAIIDEGPKGRAFNEIYTNVGRVEFTGRITKDGREIIIIHSTKPLEAGQKTYKLPE